MIVERTEQGHITDIVIYADDRCRPWSAYHVICADADINEEGSAIEPRARISLLSATSATIETALDLAREYAFVAGVAALLQAEKRAKYAEHFGALA